MWSTYLLGVATLPVALVAGWLVAALASRAVALAVRVGLGVVRRHRPTTDPYRRRMAGIMYAAERGLVFTRGRAAVLVVWDMDHERAAWAQQRLLREVKLSDAFRAKHGAR